MTPKTIKPSQLVPKTLDGISYAILVLQNKEFFMMPSLLVIPDVLDLLLEGTARTIDYVNNTVVIPLMEREGSRLDYLLGYK